MAGIGGGDRVGGVVGTDARDEQEEPVDAVEGGGQRRGLLEEKLTADLTGTEREHLMKALAKIHQAACDLLDDP
jgi:hypothetical protein